MAGLTALHMGCFMVDDGSEVDAFLVHGLAALTNLLEVGLRALGEDGLHAFGSGLGRLPLQALRVEVMSSG
jgi:hypothetical protein